MHNIVLRSYGYTGAREVPVGKSTSLYYFKIIAYTKTPRTNPMFGGTYEAVAIKAIFSVQLYMINSRKMVNYD